MSSSPISVGTHTPGGSLATGFTDYSPENLRFGSLAISESPAAAYSLGTAKVLQPLGQSQLEAVRDYVQATQSNIHHNAFNGSQSATSSDPFFGTSEKGELSTCFLYIHGDQEIFDYHNNGRFAFMLELKTFSGIHTRSKGKEVFLYYKDRRDAEQALNMMRQLTQDPTTPRSSVKAVSITAKDFCYSTRDTHKPKTLADLGPTFEASNDGQMIFIAQPPNGLPVNERVQLYAETKLKALIEKVVGNDEVRCIDIIAVDAVANTLTFLVEMYEPVKAQEIVQTFRGFRDTELVESMRVRCGLHGEEKLGGSPNRKRAMVHNHSEASISHSRYFDDDTDAVLEGEALARAPVFGVIGDKRPASFAPRKDSFDFNTDASENLSFDGDFTIATMSRRENKNYIDLNRVKHGLDVRTTVMLRNIPNRITHSMLKEVLDEYVWGRYDFMYLRIDFTNNCNVGYAFINFGHPNDVARFCERVAGKKWKYSDKVAEVSYATMQGRETLINKFRNSSVMNEGAESRPKLYKTIPDPKAGEEEDFPEPDNLFKLARSNQNAAHIGLFSPNRGGAPHLGDRHRHGRFDRGTSFALFERMMAENAMLRGMHGFPPHRGNPYY